MLSDLRFRGLLLLDRFADALAQRPGLDLGTPAALYAAYRLGMYRSVAAHASIDDARAALASIVSLAACGESDKAAALCREAMTRNMPGALRVALADALAPYMPQLARELLGHEGNPVLRAALALRNDASEEALGILDEAYASQQQQRWPELHLLQTNARQPGPAEQLAQLNAFFGSHNLTPVRLIDPGLPPSATNLNSAVELRPVDGPTVSVLMTAFRTGTRIRHALESLLAQTYRNLDIIVVDDASDDDTGSIVQAMATHDARIRYLRLPCNVGTYVAKTVGLMQSRGEFVTCHDSDDWSHPMKLALQIQPLLEDRKVVFSTSQWVRIQDDGLYYARPVHPLTRLNPASPLFRKEAVLARAGTWDLVRTGADSEFHARLRLVFGRRAMARLKMPLTLGAHRPDSLMTAAATGYSGTGMSPVRLAYWEDWAAWHVDELRNGRKPRLAATDYSVRAFPAPESILVPPPAIATCLSATY